MPQLTVRLARATYLEQQVIAAAQRFAREFEVVVAKDGLDWAITLISPAPIPADLDRLVLAAAVDEMLLEFQRQYPPAPDEQSRTVGLYERDGRLN